MRRRARGGKVADPDNANAGADTRIPATAARSDVSREHWGLPAGRALAYEWPSASVWISSTFISRFKRLPAALWCCIVASALAGCITAARPDLSVEARQSLRLTRVDVDFAPDANVHVSAVENEATNRGATTRAQVAEAGRAHIRRVLSSEFMATVGPRLAGVRPVVAKIGITRFYIPGAVAAVLVGGSSEFTAGVDLVDEKNGEVLVSIPPGRIANTVYRPGGILGVAVQVAAAGDPAEIKTREMSHTFAADHANWLTER